VLDLTDEDWAATLSAARAALRPGGHLIFETRDPAARAWLGWNREASLRHIDGVATWCEVTGIDTDLVSFRWTFAFDSDGVVLSSDSTLRFRRRDEIAASLRAAGFAVKEVRDAPDRPGREFVFIASDLRRSLS